jgi:hypothetical protein
MKQRLIGKTQEPTVHARNEGQSIRASHRNTRATCSSEFSFERLLLDRIAREQKSIEASKLAIDVFVGNDRFDQFHGGRETVRYLLGGVSTIRFFYVGIPIIRHRDMRGCVTGLALPHA